MSKNEVEEGVSADASLEELFADPETNLRPIEKVHAIGKDEPAAVAEIQTKKNEKIASFIISVCQHGIIEPVRVRPKGAKGYPVTLGFQRVGAVQFVTRANELVDEMLDITAREEKLPEDKQAEGLVEDREKLEKKYGEFLPEFLTWKETIAAKELLAEQRGTVETEKDPFSVAEISKLLKGWLPKIKVIPVRIFEDKSEIDRTFLQLAENIDRQDLSPMAEARGISKLVDHYVEKKEMEKIPAMELVGRRLGGRCLSWVQQSLSLLKTAPEVQEALESGDVSRSQGLVIAREKGKGNQVELLDRARKGATVKSLNKIRKPAKTEKASGKPKKGRQATLLPTGPKLEFKVGKHEIVFEEEDGVTSEYVIKVDGEVGLRVQITKKGAVKIAGASSELLSLKTELGHLQVQHDSSLEERFSVDVDGIEVGGLVLDGKGDVSFEEIKKADRTTARAVKGKKKSAAKKAKAKKASGKKKEAAPATAEAAQG